MRPLVLLVLLVCLVASHAAAADVREAPIAVDANPDRWLPPSFRHANLTAVKTLTSGTTFAVYMGKAQSRYTSIVVRWRVTTAAATITWAEVAIATGSGSMAGASTLTTRGYTDVATAIATAGQKNTTIAVTGIDIGDDLWVILGNSSTTAGIIRAGLADDLQTGNQASAVARPSTMGAGTSFAVEGATAMCPWVAIEAT